MTNRRTYRTDSYFNKMYDDVLEYIGENINLTDYTEDGELDRETLEEKLNDECFVSDSVTGNASGSYYLQRIQSS